MKSFHLPAHLWQEPFVLDGAEAHHLNTVLRIGVHQRVRLFDGAGRDGVFKIMRQERNKTWLVPEGIETHPHPARRITLAMGWAKSARRGWLLEKAVELQADGLIFWQSERSQGQVPTAPKPAWQSQMLTAAKQCGNPWLPTLAVAPDGARQLVRLHPRFDAHILFWEQAGLDALFDPAVLPAQGRLILVLGPEGGLTDAEVGIFSKAGYRPASLGNMILRWETAALLCLGLCYWAGMQDP
jgi:16S rRNA (uracil1498-N3)-methyltransferase